MFLNVSNSFDRMLFVLRYVIYLVLLFLFSDIEIMASGCVTQVELTISCTKLLSKDALSKSDPICVIQCFEESSKTWFELDRTEHIRNTENPVFSKKVTIDYYFEEIQKLRFQVFDIDNSTSTLKDDDFLGKLKCTLGNIVSAKTYQQALMLKGKKQAGKSLIKIVAEEISDNNELALTVKGSKLDNKDFMGKSDPFLEFWRENDDKTWSLAHRTEVVKNSLDPVWKTMTIPMHSLCKGNYSNKIKVICSDWDDDGGHDVIGEFYTSVTEIENAVKPIEFKCINEKKKAKKSSYKGSGTIIFQASRIQKTFSFLNYIFGGLQINFTVGVDFTGSNGDPSDPHSLHYQDNNYLNEYMQALLAVGSVIQDYDTDKLFPAFGFGAKVPPGNRVEHEFPLNFNPTNPYCKGVLGIVQAYQQAIRQVKLWGPTNISPIISHVAKFALEAQNAQTSPQNYFVLLIITDGVITDIAETLTAIVNASHLPMSIIIVGVGTADFTAMEMLDGDGGVLKSPQGHKAIRDIVQFVPFHEVKMNGPTGLAKAVLAEVPAQVTRYFKQKGMEPGPSSRLQQK
uniref:copine-3-like n=1 Tax=Styela clava TaxID=7725 RepID=UPI001939F5C3|nr:copine-3-like [Styela clava]